MKKIDLSGSWSFCLDQEKSGIDKKFYNQTLPDSILLPATVATARKTVPSKERNEGYLTDPYSFEGFTWYAREVEFENAEDKELFLVLERTRITHVWVDDSFVGSQNSLCTSHRYQLTPYINKSKHKLTILVDNTSYPVKGGHMTSPDTQTNWDGITGEIYIEVRSKAYLSKAKIYPDVTNSLIKVITVLKGTERIKITAAVADENRSFPEQEYCLSEGENIFHYPLKEAFVAWSEHIPKLYTLRLKLIQNNASDALQEQTESYDFTFGFREFKAAGKYFQINGSRTFLRGKHDGMIFPMTGHAPTDLNSWLKVMKTAKEYGINHYRFHTCCPPEAAFYAADLLGIYMEPELPFWGTVTVEGDDNHDEQAQQYLIEEGYRILDEFGNHPSFVMMSLGNELWGSKERLNEILGGYRAYDTRHMYTQGSNNFQFMPCVLENEDFFCGVRFSKDRLFRGSYAMCDAPQGHVQTMAPDMYRNYDQIIRPSNILSKNAAGGEVIIQYGTGTKTVKMDASAELIPEIPVVSHEIGQYAMYPDYSEISKYTGVLKARNFEVFIERLEKTGMSAMSDLFFKASGRLAVECYKAELETAMRSNELAGFQLLDLQDFTGQGTALIGVLNAFMESKGLISSSEWRQFCNDTVLLAELPKLVYKTGENVDIIIKLACFKPESIINPRIEFILANEYTVIASDVTIAEGEYNCGVFNLCSFKITMPKVDTPMKLKTRIKITGSEVCNSYDLWLYPGDKTEAIEESIVITDSTREALQYLTEGKKVLYYPSQLNDTNSIQGAYCTDFWCYPMFRTISESMGKPVPIGTLGLLINHKHRAFEYFPTEFYTTAQWYDIVTNSRALILDDTDMEPLVWSIDNFERNHRLGILFELKVGEGKLMVCTSNLRRLTDSSPAKWLEYSILKYISSKEFNPATEIDRNKFNSIFN